MMDSADTSEDSGVTQPLFKGKKRILKLKEWTRNVNELKKAKDESYFNSSNKFVNARETGDW